MPPKRQKENLAWIAATVGGAAVAGFGLAFGRDIYGNIRRNLTIIALFLIVIAGPYLGGRELVRGHDRGIWATVIITGLGSIGLIAAGFAATFGVVILALVLVASTLAPDQTGAAMATKAWLLTFAVTAVCMLAGMTVGLMQRGPRLQVIAVRHDNEQFLRAAGIVETDGTDISHYDPDGEPLRFLEAHPGRLVFMAVGRRGKRAYITLDPEGRMLRYSGIA